MKSDAAPTCLCRSCEAPEEFPGDGGAAVGQSGAPAAATSPTADVRFMLPRVRDDERAVSAKKDRIWPNFVPPLGLAAALVGTAEFGRGAVNVIFIVSSAVSGFLVCIWLLHLFRAQLNAVVPPPKARQQAAQRREQAREGRVLPGTRALVILAAGIPAAVLMQLSDRAGGRRPSACGRITRCFRAHPWGGY